MSVSLVTERAGGPPHGRHRPGLLELAGLRRRYGRTVTLDGLSFTVEPGRIFGFLGPPGAGKTTAMPNNSTLAPPQFGGKYLSLTTFKHDGTGVAGPVWFVTEAGKILVVTDAESYKVRRIRRNPSVTVAECTASGRLRSSPVPARAQILSRHEAARAGPLMAHKYRLDKIVILRSTVPCKPSAMAAATQKASSW